MRLLVCGGAGFIGSNFIRYCLKNHSDAVVVNYDKLTYAGNLDNLSEVKKNKRYAFVRGDIADLAPLNKVIKKWHITHIINFAAETHVDRSIHGGAKEFVLTNTLGVQMILDAARFNGIQKFVNVSTDEVYGSLALNDPSKFSEDTPIAPNMPYAAAKAGGDLMCRAYFVTHGVPVVVTHCSNNYGPFQSEENFIPVLIGKALKNEPLPLYGTGKNVRDWLYVRDHCEAILRLLEKGKIGEIYNIGADNDQENLMVAKMILKLLDKPESLIQFVEDRPGHDERYSMNYSKMEKELGWRPSVSFEEGMRETLAWYIVPAYERSYSRRGDRLTARAADQSHQQTSASDLR